jgi:glutamine synthetase
MIMDKKMNLEETLGQLRKDLSKGLMDTKVNWMKDQLEDIENIAENEGIKVVDVRGIDIFGNLKFKSVPIKDIYHYSIEGTSLDGSSIKGYGVSVQESDLKIIPQLQTLHRAPWQDALVVICNIYDEDKPFEGDPRFKLEGSLNQMNDRLRDILPQYKKNIETGLFKSIKSGKGHFEFYVAPELEFFILDKDMNVIDKTGYFDAPSLHMRKMLNDIMGAMQTFGTRFETYHKEVSASQYEFGMRYNNALNMADSVVILKETIKNRAEMDDLLATFMPKPFFGINGSGMHCHMNLAYVDENEKAYNLFAGEKGELSTVGKKFVAGLLKHAPAITALTNPTINSYKRLVPGYEAPVNIAWGMKNRTTQIRVPDSSPKARRIEFRSPDPSCNPYLAFNAMLAGGLAGIENNYEVEEPTEKDLFDPVNRKGVPQLPGKLSEALTCLEGDDVIKAPLGEVVVNNFVRAKKTEIERYSITPSDVETRMYLDV